MNHRKNTMNMMDNYMMDKNSILPVFHIQDKLPRQLQTDVLLLVLYIVPYRHNSFNRLATLCGYQKVVFLSIHSIESL